MKDREKYQFVIEKFVGKDFVQNWGIEVKMAKRLLALYPRFDFWQGKQPKKFASLCCLLTGKAKAFLSKTYDEYVLENPVEVVYNLTEKPIQSELPIEHKPRSLVDFIRK
jgi:hypothetical protein